MNDFYAPRKQFFFTVLGEIQIHVRKKNYFNILKEK